MMPVKKAAQSQANPLLRQARQERGWSQQRVADLIEAPQAFMVTRWESGTAFPGPGYRRKLCEIFGKSPEELGLLRPPSEPPPNDLPGPIYDPALPLRILQTRTLIGRKQILSQLQQELCYPFALKRLAIEGLPGVGKTTLAAELAISAEVRMHFADGVLWAGLGPHPNIQAHLYRWGKLLNLPEVETTSSVEKLAEALRLALWKRNMLIVLDDVWEIEDALACEVVGPDCACLISTRIPEVAIRFAGKRSMHLAELSEQEGIDLLAQIAPEVRKMDLTVVRSLVQAVGGLPLALTLMGNYLLLQSRHGQSRRVQAALIQLQRAEERLLLAQPQVGIERDARLPVGTPLTLQAMISLSEAILDEETRQALFSLAVFPAKPDSFSEEAALAVSNTRPEVLDRLVDVGLLESGGNARYLLHQTIADYSSMQSRSTIQAKQRLATYIFGYIEQHQNEYRALDEELPLILLALELGPTVDRQAEFVRGLNAVASFLRTRGFLALTEQFLQQAYKIERDQSSSKHLNIWYELATLLCNRGAYEQANALLEEGLALARQQSDTLFLCRMLSCKGRVAAECCEYAQAEGYYLDALTQARQLNDPSMIASMLNNLSTMLIAQGDLSLAENYIGEVLKLENKKSNTRDDEADISIMANLGWVQGKQGKFIEAEKHFQQAIALARSTKNYDALSQLLVQSGWTLLRQDDYPRARACLQEAISLGRQIGRIKSIAEVLVLQALLALKEGAIKQAIILLQEACLPIQQIGNKADVVHPFLLAKGLAEIQQEQYEQARATLRKGLEMARQVRCIEYTSGFLALLGSATLALGELEQAHILLQESLDLARNTDLPWLLGTGLIIKGRYHLLLQEYEQAAACYQEILSHLSSAYREYTARAHEGLAMVAQARGQLSLAYLEGQVALHILEEIGHGRAPIIRNWLAALPKPDMISKGGSKNSA